MNLNYDDDIKIPELFKQMEESNRKYAIVFDNLNDDFVFGYHSHRKTRPDADRTHMKAINNGRNIYPLEEKLSTSFKLDFLSYDTDKKD
jgi:hypothetical protein